MNDGGAAQFSVLPNVLSKRKGRINVVLATWVEGMGWLVSRPGLVEHGILKDDTEDDVVLHAKSGFRAIQTAMKRAGK